VNPTPLPAKSFNLAAETLSCPTLKTVDFPALSTIKRVKIII
jgi:hypothetical protein